MIPIQWDSRSCDDIKWQRVSNTRAVTLLLPLFVTWRKPKQIFSGIAAFLWCFSAERERLAFMFWVVNMFWVECSKMARWKYWRENWAHHTHLTDKETETCDPSSFLDIPKVNTGVTGRRAHGWKWSLRSLHCIWGDWSMADCSYLPVVPQTFRGEQEWSPGFLTPKPAFLPPNH